MFSPLNDPQVEQWFQRLNTPLGRLPAEERAELYAEVRQHLDALAAANEELGSPSQEAWGIALAQFGDPAQIGERLFQEYQESRSGSRLGWCSVGLSMMLYPVCILINALWSHSQDTSQGVVPVNFLLAYGATALVSFAVGRKYPFHAIKGTFYAYLFWRVDLLLLYVAACSGPHAAAYTGPYNANYGYNTLDGAVLVNAAHWASSGLIGILINGGSAYLASVTKRGWYKPSPADFKLTLPRKQRNLSR